MGSVWLTAGRVAGSLARAGLEEKAEHARVGGPAGQDSDRVPSPRLAQLLQQPGDRPRVVEAGVDGGPGGQDARSDRADPAFGTPDFDTERGRTWYLRVARSGRIRVVVWERRRRPGWMLRPAARPLSDFPIEAVEEAIAQTVLASGKTWP